MRALGIVLIVLGVLALIYGGFWYTKDDTKAEIGPVKIKVEERDRVNIPLWAGIGSIGVGALLLATGKHAAA